MFYRKSSLKVHEMRRSNLCILNESLSCYEIHEKLSDELNKSIKIERVELTCRNERIIRVSLIETVIARVIGVTFYGAIKWIDC